MNKAETQFSNIINIITLNYNKPLQILYEYNEDYIMSLLFTSRFNVNNTISRYFLSKDYMAYISFDSNKYYDYNMKKIEVTPLNKTNQNIVDVELSLLNSQHIIKFYFLLDFLAEFYSSLSSKSKIIRIKSRYIIEDKLWVQYKKADYYTFDIEYSYDDKSGQPFYRIKNIQDSSVNAYMLNEMCTVFKDDIIKHLTFISKKDIQKGLAGGNNYLDNIKTFYKFCRLKISFYTLKCIIYETKNINVQAFLESQLAYYFLNLKNRIEIKNVDQKNILVTNTLLLSKVRLQKLNERAAANRGKKVNYNRNQSCCLILMILFVLAITFALIGYFIGIF